jgi:hypothetical protein
MLVLYAFVDKIYIIVNSGVDSMLINTGDINNNFS